MAYTNEQLMQKLRNAHNAGDTYAAKRFAEMIRDNEKPEEPEQEKGLVQSASDMITGADRETQAIEGLREVTGAPELGGLSEFSWEGLKELGSNFTPEAFKAAGGLLTTGDPKEQMKIIQSNYPDASFRPDEKGNVIVGLPSGEYVLNAPGLSTSDLTNFIAQGLAFTPAGRAATIPAAIGKSAATQAAIEGAGAATGGEFNPEEVALAGGIGGAGKLAEDAIGGAYRLATGKMSDDATKQIADIEAQGLKARTQDVVQPETLPGKMAANVGELNPLTAGQQAAQQRTRQEATESYVKEFTPSYDEIKKSVENKLGAKFKQAIEDRKKGIDAAKGSELKTSDLIRDINKEISKLMKSSSGQRKSTADNSAIKVLQDYKNDIKNATDIEELADYRTSFREAMQPDFGKKSTTKDGIIKRVYGSITKAMDDTIRPNLSPSDFAKYKRGNALYGKTSEEINKGRIKNILQGGEDLSPEQIDRVLLNNDSVVRAKMYRSLDDKGKENARAAIIRKLADDASRGGELSVNMFLKKLRDNDKALQTFFRGRDRKELEGLRNALEATRSAQDAAVNPPTGQRLAPYLVGGGAIADLGLTIAGTLGSAIGYKAYQSKPVRNALLKLANTPKGSSAFEKALSDLNSALLPFVQSSTSTE